MTKFMKGFDIMTKQELLDSNFEIIGRINPSGNEEIEVLYGASIYPNKGTLYQFVGERQLDRILIDEKFANIVNRELNVTPWGELLSLKDAAIMYGKEESTLRRAISSGRLQEGVDCKKFGKQWVILKSSMDRVYK